MQEGHSERRLGRRVGLEVPLLIRREGTSDDAFHQEVTKNVSLAGVYFEADGSYPLTLNESVMASVSISEAHTREFPFTRLAGRGRVVRVSPLPSEQGKERQRVGVALEFGKDVTALTAIPHR